MKQILIALLSIAVLAACGPAPTPAPTVDINATISALSETMVAGTLTAQPTATVPPTETPTPTPPPVTDTPVPSPTLEPTTTLTPVPFVGCFAPAGVGNIKLGVFRMENNTKKKVAVYLNGTSLSGNKTVNCSFDATVSFNTEIIFGKYSYIVQVGDKRSFDGTFSILNDDKTTMRIFDNKVIVVGP
jgi:hypothetical protein